MKVAGYIILSIIVLVILIALSIQIPAVQNKIVQEGVNFLHKKIGTTVKLDHISISFPKAITLEGLYVEDQHQDTLLYAGELSVDTDLWALLSNEIDLNTVDVTNTTAYVSRSQRDSTFNFDFIIKAFAGEPSSVPTDTSAASWKFNIGDISLQNIKARYYDSLIGSNMRVQLASLEVDVDALDLDNSSLSIDNIELTDARGEMVQWKSPSNTSGDPNQPVDSADAGDAFNISVKDIKLSEVNADYRNLTAGQHARLNLGEFVAAIEEMDLLTQTIKVKEVKLLNTFLSYQQSDIKEKSKPTKEKANDQSAQAVDTELPWKISVVKVELSNDNIQYYDFSKPQVTQGIDFGHLWLRRFGLDAEDLKLSGSDLAGTLNNLTLVDKSGYSISSMKGLFMLSDTAAQLKNFQYVSPSSSFALDASGTYTSLETLGDEYQEADVKLNLKNSKVALAEVLYFAPNLLDSLPLKITPETQINLTAEAAGKVKDLTIQRITANVLSSTSLSASGRIRGLPDANPQMQLVLNKFYTTKKDVNALVADTLIPKNISLPDWIDLRGKFAGTVNSPKVSALLQTSMGSVSVDGKLDQPQRTPATYDGKVAIKNFDVGKLIGQAKTMGKLTMNGEVNGAGLTMDELNTRLKVTVNSFEYNKYLYRNFNVDGRLKKYFFSGKALLQDKNLDFVMTGDLDYNQDVPQYKLKLDLKNADFKALNLSERPLKARLKLEVDLATSDFTKINGDVGIRKVAIYNGDALYAVDSLLFASIDQEGDSKITIRSDIISGDFDGTINLLSIPDALSRHFNEYYSLHDSTYQKPIPPQKFTFNLTLKNTDLLTELLMPDLEPFVPGKIQGQFDSEQNILGLQIDVARIRYGTIGLDSMQLNVISDNKSLDYTLALRKIMVDTLKVEALKLSGKVANDSIRTRMIILDSTQRQKYIFGGVFYSQQDAFQFRFLPDEVVLNNAPWKTPADNYLRFTKAGILAHNFSITNINEKISLITRDEKDARTAIEFKDLNLQNITNIVEGTILADGLINGDFVISGKGAFKSALNVKTLKIVGNEWGDLSLKVDHSATGPYQLDVALAGDNVELGAKGTFISDSVSSKIDIAADISRINLKVIQPLTGGQLKDASGIVTGEVTVKGEATSPEIRGFLAFENAVMVPSFVNSKFTLKDERVDFTNTGIILENFRITDANNNVAAIKGEIKTKDYTEFEMNLGLSAKNFQLMNTKAEDSELFYGKVGISTTAKITGSFTQPKVEMEISLDDDSDFTYVIPETEKGLMEQEGIVRWRDKDAEKDPFLSKIKASDTLASKFTGLDLTANIELDDKESFSIVIDPVTGDKLTVKGNSTLTLDIDPTGDMTLSGRYEITQGSYDFTFYKLVKRKFAIEKGSTITWSGEPLDAVMDIKASFIVETSPAELMGEQTTTNTSQARLPFIVYLNIDGNLLTPEISFELDMPKDKQNAQPGVYARIKDINTRESDLNKQVFALLILRRFISDNIFDSQGSGVAGTARRSVSKLLTEQLNRLSQNIKGFELSFDVKSYEDYSNGSAQGQTEVQLGVTKSLFDDRLVVKVSGNVDIEGNSSSQSSLSDYIGDLALEYKLTPDGRFRITGFRKSNYDIISGELIETGAGLIYIKDYETFRELFKANAKAK